MEEKKEEVHARVSQAVITDIGSAIVGATKAHRPEASPGRTEGNGREDRGKVERNREKDTERGQR